ncbi:Holliday junction DNA helicase [Halalkalicoccus jeotgali]|uniref:Holliday junction resolvase n=1 Tax=Halalkalicoccus jeotgali (strain DSM 18796 / CECT 7217 / JCM 14584 / KCTC 4019 / B3) TaxID=795797 RepID=D8J9L1_HALJB|nr:Holliday junction DNA helicase [Halalkalicoccus jeotgali]ADJ14423.1 holliday junction resolvase [Halalkalicoccus jeotgali B3]ELY40139.1 holliday junction resolvase [Halalkalicoccus jeotgali B3]
MSSGGAASGAGTASDRPDLLASREYNGRLGVPSAVRPLARVYAIEAKASKTGSVTLAHEEIEGLCRYALAFGARPLVAVRPDREPWSFFEPAALNQNEQSRSVTQDMLPGPSFEEVFDDGE